MLNTIDVLKNASLPHAQIALAAGGDRHSHRELYFPGFVEDIRVYDEDAAGRSHLGVLSSVLSADGKGQVPVRLWIAPPTRMDEKQLVQEGVYNVFGRTGARTEVPGCSLCMGNQARVADGTTVLSTSTRNFPNRMGDDTSVFLGSAELAAITAGLGRLPAVDEYRQAIVGFTAEAEGIYRNLNFDQIEDYLD